MVSGTTKMSSEICGVLITTAGLTCELDKSAKGQTLHAKAFTDKHKWAYAMCPYEFSYYPDNLCSSVSK